MRPPKIFRIAAIMLTVAFAGSACSGDHPSSPTDSTQEPTATQSACDLANLTGHPLSTMPAYQGGISQPDPC